ncbi:MAG TPA: DUF2024 family protein [Xanthomarina sp.]|nr:DUF2024 family protein [Xanthomarina sp.]
MKISVWDTYVKREDGNIMHFDILVPSHITEKEVIFNFGTQYLKTKPFKTQKLTAKECQYCHIEKATEPIISDIEKNGYAIIEMEHCN